MAALINRVIVHLQHEAILMATAQGETSDGPTATDKPNEAETMAYTNTARAGNATVLDRVTATIRSLRGSIERRRLYNQTLRELGALTDRDLADVGLHPSIIADVAREAAYGK
jgi:uncharacterized protein YjiS (DUF1127 family)